MIVAPRASEAIVKQDGTMHNAFRRFTLQISRLGIMTGTGSPEGVVEALQTQEYMDETGTAGAIKYIKRDADIGGDKTQGWILV